MHHRITAGVGILAALAIGAGVGHARMPADLATAHAVRPAVMASEWPTRNQAEVLYYHSTAPSAAWRHASAAEREHATAEYLGLWDGGEGCLADLRHSYQGTTDDTTWVQPNLPVEALDGGDVLLADYTDGVCGE